LETKEIEVNFRRERFSKGRKHGRSGAVVVITAKRAKKPVAALSMKDKAIRGLLQFGNRPRDRRALL
jgi:hypothetical protein